MQWENLTRRILTINKLMQDCSPFVLKFLKLILSGEHNLLLQKYCSHLAFQ